MCLILFAYKTNPEWPLIVASNRDEAYSRPTQEAHFWADAPKVLAGRDLEMGGTWMGMDLEGRFAALTNFREGFPQPNAPKSRGELVQRYLMGHTKPEPYLDAIKAERHLYAGYSCLMGDVHQLYFHSNRCDEIFAIEPGVHGLSNAFLDTPWPKVTSGQAQLTQLLSNPLELDREALFKMLQDTKTFQDAMLPQTGIPMDRERALSAKFIAMDERYGTRSSTVIMVHRSGQVQYAERGFAPWGRLLHTSEFLFQLNPSRP